MACFTFARIDPETLKITLSYNTNGGSKWAEGDLECLIPFDVLADQAIRDPETGAVTLEADPLKVQAKLDAAWTSLRTERNQLLRDSDWVALADAHLSQDKKDAWFAYRQELRDLPDLVTDPLSVEWPLVPGSVPVVQATGSRLSSLLDAAQ
jgi:hypothetical protein